IPLVKKSFLFTRQYNTPDTHVGKDAFGLDFVSADNGQGCNEAGSPILATKKGIVSKIDETWWGGGYGNHVTLEHDGEIKSIYGHMIHGSIAVKPGQVVEKGQLIGLMGGTGNILSSTNCGVWGKGIHLHFAVWDISADKDGNEIRTAKKPEPLGKAFWINIPTTLPKWEIILHDTSMFDPTDHFNSFTLIDEKNNKHRPPFRLLYQNTIARAELTLPKHAAFGVRTRFRFEGNDLDLANAYVIERCVDSKTITHTENLIEVECTPTDQSELSKDNGYSDSLYFMLKYGPGAEMITQGYVKVVRDETSHIESIEPLNPVYGEKTLFTAWGNKLLPSISISNPGCENISMLETEGSRSPYHVEFTCTPTLDIHPDNNAFLTLDAQFTPQSPTHQQDLLEKMKSWSDTHPISFHIEMKDSLPPGAIGPLRENTNSQHEVFPISLNFADAYSDNPELGSNGTSVHDKIRITRMSSETRKYRITLLHPYPLLAKITIPQCLSLNKKWLKQEYECLINKADHLDITVQRYSGALLDEFTATIREVYKHQLFEPTPSDSLTYRLEIEGVNLPTDSDLLIEHNFCESGLKNLYRTPNKHLYECQATEDFANNGQNNHITVKDLSGIVLYTAKIKE
ncbi:MAG: M23 family metallopeptidase, partial [Candidatus Gracilibacteria bacterium]|nr:M23 family metallopeptidase [Candidatus Gracilibacteria bacterium]